MELNLNVQQIRALDMTEIQKRLIVDRERVRVREKHEDQYRLLKFLGWQFQDEIIIDLGTRRGTSAVCLADNPKNAVYTFDIVAESKGFKHAELFVHCPNVLFNNMNIHDISDMLLLSSPLIYLDIDHSGDSEDRFFNHLKEIGYSGYVFCDDVNFPRKFPHLQKVFKKHNGTLLPRGISHDTGTGVLIYGDHTLNVDETYITD
jgi:hypothetical protein